MYKKMYSCMIFMCILLFPLGVYGSVAKYDGEPMPVSYREYSLNVSKDAASHEVTINNDQLIKTGEQSSLVKNYKGNAGEVLLTGETGSDTWKFDVENDGAYQIEVEYYPLEGRSTEIQKLLSIDGKVPFLEAQSIVFQRHYVDAGPISRNKSGDDIQPGQVEAAGWYHQVLQDYQGFINEPYVFYFSKGRHTLRLESIKDSMAVAGIRLFGAEKISDYKTYIAQYKSMEAVQAEPLYMQAEQPFEKSSSGLSPYEDRTSTATMPSSPVNHKLNIINGLNWNKPGQWISWKINIDKPGLYKIMMRWQQNVISGFSSVRELYIDGKIPFEEARNFKFDYSSDWKVSTLADNNHEPYLFYFDKGQHEIKLEAATGTQMAKIISDVDACLLKLNSDYRRITMLTGTTPDENRDYDLESYVPDALEDLDVQRDSLEKALGELTEYSGESGESGSEIQRVITQIKAMVRDADTIPRRLESFKDDLSGLAEWMVTALNQPLSVDYMVVASPEEKVPRAGNGFFSNLVFEIRMFLSSFRNQNNYLSDENVKKDTITVWMAAQGTTAGRDQAQVMRKLVDNYFTSQRNINVDLELVAPGTLLPATFANKGPDVYLQMASSEAVNYGLRNALVDLSKYPGFEELEKDFVPQIWVPYSFDGKVYGLPETQNFPMFFYRKDILEKELGYSIGDHLNWNDILVMLPDTLKKNMTVWIPPDPTMYFTLLKQYGGDFYRTDSLRTALDTQEAYNSFKFFTDFFTGYNLPQEINFMNRFRTGECPMGIVDYTMANYLAISAPDIRGLWDFCPIPGVVREDGSVDNTGYLTSSGCVMLEQSGHKAAAWEFMKWWTGAEAQGIFGRNIEEVLGPAGRYNAASIKAFESLPWSNSDLIKLNRQLAVSQARRELPGGYYTEREINFAIKKVIIDDKNPRESLLDYMTKIDDEIKAKCDELRIDLNTPYRQ